MSTSGTFDDRFISDQAIGPNELKNGALSADANGRAKIAHNYFNSTLVDTSFQNESISGEKIGNFQISTVKIANSAVNTSKIADKSVTLEKIANGVIPTGTNIPNNSITENKIANGAVSEFKIKIGAVTNSRIASNAITADKIINSTITAPKIVNGEITTEKIKNLAVTVDKLSANAKKSVAANKIIAIWRTVLNVDATAGEAGTIFDVDADIRASALVDDVRINANSGVGILLTGNINNTNAKNIQNYSAEVRDGATFKALVGSDGTRVVGSIYLTLTNKFRLFLQTLNGQNYAISKSSTIRTLDFMFAELVLLNDVPYNAFLSNSGFFHSNNVVA